MKLYYPITIDLYKVYPLQVMEAQQGNVGRGAIVTLTAGSAVIDPTDETVEVYAKKPDGTVSWLECSVEEGKIKIDFTNQMLMSPGMLQVELRLMNDTDDITTPIFMVRINKSNVQSAGRSENELPVLDYMLDKISYYDYQLISDGETETVITKTEVYEAGTKIKYIVPQEGGNLNIFYFNTEEGTGNGQGISWTANSSDAGKEEYITVGKYYTYTFSANVEVFEPTQKYIADLKAEHDADIIALEKALQNKSDKKILMAEVGQVVVVKEVNVFGHALEFEAVDMPTGGVTTSYDDSTGDLSIVGSSVFYDETTGDLTL